MRRDRHRILDSVDEDYDYTVSDRGGLPWYRGHLGPTLGDRGRTLTWRADMMAGQLWLVCRRTMDPQEKAHPEDEFMAGAGACAASLTGIAVNELGFMLPVEATLLGEFRQVPAGDIASRATIAPVVLDGEPQLGIEWRYGDGAMFATVTSGAWLSGLISSIEPDHQWRLTS